MEIKIKQLADLKFADYNPRQITDEQFAELKISISKFRMVEPPIINSHKGRENVIVGGHMRVRAMLELGIKESKCVIENYTLEEEKEINIRLNKNIGVWDYDKLANNYGTLELLDFGFTKKELSIDELDFDMDMEIEEEEDDDEDDQEDLVNIYQMGSHKLTCGNNESYCKECRTIIKTWEELTGKKAKLIKNRDN